MLKRSAAILVLFARVGQPGLQSITLGPQVLTSAFEFMFAYGV